MCILIVCTFTPESFLLTTVFLVCVQTIKTARLLQPRRDRQSESQPQASDPKFLREMANNVYVDGSMSMTERLQRNKHYHQSGGDLESSKFLDR